MDNKLKEFKIHVSNYCTLKRDMEAGRAYPKASVMGIMKHEAEEMVKLLPDIETLIESLESQQAELKPSDEDVEKVFEKWIINEVGIQDADIFSNGSLVREVAIKYAKAMRDGKISPQPDNIK